MPRLDAPHQLDGLEVARAAPVAAFAGIRSRRPNRFTRSEQVKTGRARRAFKEDGPGHALMDALGDAAYFFTLTPADLDESLSDDPGGLYVDTVSDLLAAVAVAFSGPVYAVAEVGKGGPGRRGRLHVHCIAHREDGPQHIKRNTERCKAVYDIFGLYRYLHKPPEAYSLAAELDAAAAGVMRPSRRLPNTRRHLITPERLAWAASQCAYDQTPPEHPNTTPSEAPRADLHNPVDETRETPLETPQKPTERASHPFDQLAAFPSPSESFPKARMSSERSGGDAPERSGGKTPGPALPSMPGTLESRERRVGDPTTRRAPRACRHRRGARAPPPRPRPRRPLTLSPKGRPP